MKKKVVKLVKKQKISPAAAHLLECARNFTSNDDPVVGHAIVTFHASHGYCASWYAPSPAICPIDIPEMARVRLRDIITKSAPQ